MYPNVIEYTMFKKQVFEISVFAFVDILKPFWYNSVTKYC